MESIRDFSLMCIGVPTDTHQKLLRNMDTNNTFPRYTLIHTAVWEKNCGLEMLQQTGAEQIP